MEFYNSQVVVKKYSVKLVKGRKQITEVSSVNTFADIQTTTPQQKYLDNGLISKDKFFNIFFDNFFDFNFYEFLDGRNGEASVVIQGDLKYKIIGKEVDTDNNYSHAIAVLTND